MNKGVTSAQMYKKLTLNLIEFSHLTLPEPRTNLSNPQSLCPNIMFLLKKKKIASKADLIDLFSSVNHCKLSLPTWLSYVPTAPLSCSDL